MNIILKSYKYSRIYVSFNLMISFVGHISYFHMNKVSLAVLYINLIERIIFSE